MQKKATLTSFVDTVVATFSLLLAVGVSTDATGPRRPLPHGGTAGRNAGAERPALSIDLGLPTFTGASPRTSTYEPQAEPVLAATGRVTLKCSLGQAGELILATIDVASQVDGERHASMAGVAEVRTTWAFTASSTSKQLDRLDSLWITRSVRLGRVGGLRVRVAIDPDESLLDSLARDGLDVTVTAELSGGARVSTAGAIAAALLPPTTVDPKADDHAGLITADGNMAGAAAAARWTQTFAVPVGPGAAVWFVDRGRIPVGDTPEEIAARTASLDGVLRAFGLPAAVACLRHGLDRDAVLVEGRKPLAAAQGIPTTYDRTATTRLPTTAAGWLRGSDPDGTDVNVVAAKRPDAAAVTPEERDQLFGFLVRSDPTPWLQNWACGVDAVAVPTFVVSARGHFGLAGERPTADVRVAIATKHEAAH